MANFISSHAFPPGPSHRPRTEWVTTFTPLTTFDEFCREFFAFTYIDNPAIRKACCAKHIEMCRSVVLYNWDLGRPADAVRLDYLMRRIHSPWHHKAATSTMCACFSRKDFKNCGFCTNVFDRSMSLGFGDDRMDTVPDHQTPPADTIQWREYQAYRKRSDAAVVQWLNGQVVFEPLPYEPWTFPLVPSLDESQSDNHQDTTTTATTATTTTTTTATHATSASVLKAKRSPRREGTKTSLPPMPAPSPNKKTATVRRNPRKPRIPRTQSK